MATYVLIFGKLHRVEDQRAFEEAFEQLSHTIMQTVEGIMRDELLHDSNDPCAYILLSEWKDKQAWAAWQSAPIHEQQVGHLQQYWKGQGVKICSTVYCVEQLESSVEPDLIS